MTSYHLDIQQKKLHYLISGEGPPIMLFHASPMSSASLRPLIDQLSKRFTVIAPDTPGYGFSESPNEQPSDIIEYVNVFEAFRQELGIEKMALYGTATGAQIAIRYGLTYPSVIEQIFLDNTAHFTLEEKTDIFEHYFPDLTPTRDGGHLSVVWEITDNLFRYFPWCFQREQFKLSPPVPPPSVLHMVALEYLKAGAQYDWAYRAAFLHEDRKYIADLTVPTLIFRWEQSILTSYTDRIFEIDLPEIVNYKMITKEEDRHQSMADAIARTYRGMPVVLTSRGDEMTKEEIPILDLDFPSPEPSGKYLLEAWNQLNNTIGKTTSLEQLSRIYIQWASTNRDKK